MHTGFNKRSEKYIKLTSWFWKSNFDTVLLHTIDKRWRLSLVHDILRCIHHIWWIASSFVTILADKQYTQFVVWSFDIVLLRSLDTSATRLVDQMYLGRSVLVLSIRRGTRSRLCIECKSEFLCHSYANLLDIASTCHLLLPRSDQENDHAHNQQLSLACSALECQRH